MTVKFFFLRNDGCSSQKKMTAVVFLFLRKKEMTVVDSVISKNFEPRRAVKT